MEASTSAKDSSEAMACLGMIRTSKPVSFALFLW